MKDTKVRKSILREAARILTEYAVKEDKRGRTAITELELRNYLHADCVMDEIGIEDCDCTEMVKGFIETHMTPVPTGGVTFSRVFALSHLP